MTGFASTDVWGWVLLVSVVIIAFCSVIAAVRATQAQRSVKTLGAKSLGTLASDDETRRILAKAPADRTSASLQHLHDVPPP